VRRLILARTRWIDARIDDAFLRLVVALLTAVSP
jgi:hypothetical protein